MSWPASRVFATGLLYLALVFVLVHPSRAQETEAGGGVYLFHYQPLEMEEVDPTTEVYAVHGSLRHRRGPWEGYLQVRARDTKLRAFFPSTVWVQEGWGAYHHPLEREENRLTIRAGKMVQTTGRFWDGSFFGNVHYFDGLKLNPQFGLAVSGRRALGEAVLGLDGQFLLASDRISGAITGRDAETVEGFAERFGGSLRGTARLPGGLRIGATLYDRRVVTAEASDNRAWNVWHLSADLEYQRESWTVYGEWLRRPEDPGVPAVLVDAPAASEATYWLAGAQYRAGRLHLRYNVSLGDYERAGRREWIHQPGVTVDLSEHLSAYAELNLWRSDPAAGEADWVDRSLNFVLHVTF